MYDEHQLNEKKITELKKIAEDKSIKYSKNITKKQLIGLISNPVKTLKTLKTKKTEKKVTTVKKTADKPKAKKIKPESTIKSDSKTIKVNKLKDKIEINKDESFINTSGNMNQFQTSSDLPVNYGNNKIVLMVVDPYKGYTYWEITDSFLQKFNTDYNKVDKYLRIYDITDNKTPENSNSFYDIKINNESRNWYFDFKIPNRMYIIDLSFIKDGKFVTLLRSNVVYVPRDSFSDHTDEEWMNTDENYKLIYQASGANTLFQHDGSQELMKFLAGNLEDNASSGGSKKS